jgi:sulfur-carrier protein adenylyltransferase/sulfurtransferase
MKNYLAKLSTPKKLAVLAGLLAILALVIGNAGNKNKINVNAKELALSTIKDQDKISPVTLADWLIKDKLDFTLVDLRPEKDFTEYTIPGSVNVRMEDLLNSDLKRNQKILLYGNDDVTSAQAWFILKSSDYKGVYILKGGFNSWKNEILYPKHSVSPSPVDSVVAPPSSKVVPNLPKVTIPSGTTKKKKEGC